jgi:hypothetical protein
MNNHSIHLMEDHDSALEIWRGAGVRGQTLVHYDGHLDFYWIKPGPEGESVHIGNFIEPAIREGIVSRFYWVVPDPYWKSALERRRVAKTLRTLLARAPVDVSALREEGGHFCFDVYGCPVLVGPESSLPLFHEPVLLDIDADFLLTRQCDYHPLYYREGAVEPWIWPSEFLRRLNARHLRPSVTTVACSVNGGYTPLRYKYFGESIARALPGLGDGRSDRPVPGSAAGAYEKFLSAFESKTWKNARLFWQETMRKDFSYRTLYAFAGLRSEAGRQWKAALRSYERFLEIDPDWGQLHAGRGRCLWNLKRYEAAETAFKKARARGAHEALHWLGRIAARGKSWSEANRLWSLALEKNPHDVLSRHALGRLLIRLNKKPSHFKRKAEEVFMENEISL